MQTEARVGGVVVDGGRAVAVARCPEQQQQRHIGTAAHLAAGGLAGVVSKTCTAPLARLTILFQASRIVREEGFGAFWKGNLGTIVHRLPYSAMSFYSYERHKKFLIMVPDLDDPHYAGVVNLLGPGFAGVTAAFCNLPFGGCFSLNA